MLYYILRRTFYSLWVILGVLLITFLLFRVAAGDPAAAVLGKNPHAQEIESLRDDLGSNKPLLYGNWRTTESFPSPAFDKQRTIKNIAITGTENYSVGYLTLSEGSIILSRNFNLSVDEQMLITFRGSMNYGLQVYNSSSITTQLIPINRGDAELELTIPESCDFYSIKFEKYQESAFDSQFVDSLKEVVTTKDEFPYITFLNFGLTLTTREPIKNIIKDGIGPSLSVMVPIFFFELILAIIISLFAAALKDTFIDKSLVLLSILGMSVSYLVFIIFGQWFFGYFLNWFPVWGYGSVKHIMLPVLIGTISGLGGGVRFYRTVFVNELNQEYLRTARAKGCSPLRIYCNHLLRNAMIPIISRASSILPFIFTGSLLLESYFGIPGLGYTGYNALANSDLQLVKALVVLSSFLFVAINLLADLAYAWADPRIRLK